MPLHLHIPFAILRRELRRKIIIGISILYVKYEAGGLQEGGWKEWSREKSPWLQAYDDLFLGSTDNVPLPFSSSFLLKKFVLSKDLCICFLSHESHFLFLSYCAEMPIPPLSLPIKVTWCWTLQGPRPVHKHYPILWKYEVQRKHLCLSK